MCLSGCLHAHMVARSGASDVPVQSSSVLSCPVLSSVSSAPFTRSRRQKRQRKKKIRKGQGGADGSMSRGILSEKGMEGGRAIYRQDLVVTPTKRASEQPRLRDCVKCSGIVRAPTQKIKGGQGGGASRILLLWPDVGILQPRLSEKNCARKGEGEQVPVL